MFCPAQLPRGCYFWLDPKVTKKSSHIDASTLPAGSLRFFRASRIAKAKPSFPPYAWPADMTGHALFFKHKYSI